MYVHPTHLSNARNSMYDRHVPLSECLYHAELWNDVYWYVVNIIPYVQELWRNQLGKLSKSIFKQAFYAINKLCTNVDAPATGYLEWRSPVRSLSWCPCVGACACAVTSLGCKGAYVQGAGLPPNMNHDLMNKLIKSKIHIRKKTRAKMFG